MPETTTTMPTILLRADALTIAECLDVARRGRRVAIDPSAMQAIRRARGLVTSRQADGQAHYGINTGFGSLSRTRIAPDQLRDLQRNLIRSHAAGVGPPLPREVVRGMMLLTAGSLCRGLSGVRPEVPEALVAMLNAGLTPMVPSIGSVGASGDLAPLAHVALCLMGEGEVLREDGGREAAGPRLRGAGIEPIVLEAKEGLALINGTHLMAASGALLVEDARRLFTAALVAAAMSIDASRGTDSFLDPRVHAARRQPGPTKVAAAMLGLLSGSQIIPSHAEGDPRVQDPYCLRCSPQVLGAAWDAVGYVKQAIAQELGAVTDNPLVFAGEGEGGSGEIISAGNFHGMPLAIPLDALAIALAHVAGISERRTFWMLSAFDAESRLRPYLSPTPGVSSGLMIAQYTAAACVNAAIGLATPASVANIPTSAGIEDYNSFGPRSASKARESLEHAQRVVAIELLCAAEGLEYHRPLRTGEALERAHGAIRGRVPRLSSDRPPGPDIEAIVELIASDAFADVLAWA